MKTVISVDGAKPDVATAKKYNMRYVHLPHGYDGISDDRAKELAKRCAIYLGRFIFTAIMEASQSSRSGRCGVVAGTVKPADAKNILKTAGTSENYRGLYQSVESAQPIDGKVLDELKIGFQEVEKVPPMAESMIAIEHLHDQLKNFKKLDWEKLLDHPDLLAPHEALLREQFTELLRTDEVKKVTYRISKAL